MNTVTSQASVWLKTYAEERIELLRLGPSGPLGINYVLAYDDADPATIHLNDGLIDAVCQTQEEVDLALQRWTQRLHHRHNA